MKGLKAKGHNMTKSDTLSVVQGIQSYCNDPKPSAHCIMAVSDERKGGAPSGV